MISASRTDGDGPQTTTAYSYDQVHRLSASTSPESSNSYRYDGAGNRLSWATDAAPDTGDALSVSASFNLAGQLVSETKARGASTTSTSTSTDYSYDGNGNRTRMRVAGATTDYQFDAANNLTGISRSGMVATSQVDGLGRELETSTTTKLGTTSGTQVWDGLTVVQQAGPDGTRNLLRDVFGDVALQAGGAGAGSASSWLLTDRQQSTIAQTAGARVSQLASYSDWGIQQFATTGWDAAVGYTGELSDPTTGVNRYFARGYTPTSGVWASADPHRGILTAPATQNRYGYVAGNPATLTDNLGYGWMGYGSANHIFESSAGQHMTADGWDRHLAANPDVRIKNPSTNTKAVPERHEDWWNPSNSGNGIDLQELAQQASDLAKKVVADAVAAALVAFNSMVELGMILKNAPQAWRELAKVATKAGKFIPAVGALFAYVDVGLGWDSKNPWGNTRNSISAGIATVELGSAVLTGLVAIPALQPVGVFAGVVASGTSVLGLGWDAFDLVWDIGEDFFW